ncbi:unnamed protein product [Eruca vesicaria subsp. sativa]|uniref:Uncharacterized protein n=1 Tax=Eruca vesicaria subsp. sativa TaxID=29727 RepID=A0ABC8JL68_ERUVS|nr:unnamed protein product [Eruca vesicaria subsp. sativa]
MMNAKKLVKMARKCQQRSSTTVSSTSVEKGCFVVYTAEKARFAFPCSSRAAQSI